jgi:tripartite-type tricarboxylate transporter receptor subunit TctC
MTRKLLVTVSALVSIATAGNALAQSASFPTKPVRLVVPFAAGGATDMVARLVTQKLSENWGQPVIVENRAGASGAIGTVFVAKAPADGYTLLLGGPATLSGPPAINPNLPYDNIRDFTHVSVIANFPSALVVHPSIARTLPEFIAALKANPGKYTYASSGNGTSTHMIAELFKLMTGTDMVHVPYKGTGPGLNDVMSGQVAMSFAPINAVTGSVQSNRLRALGVTSLKRSPEFPDVPTIGEVVTGFEADSWLAVSAPANTPQPIVQKLAADLRQAVHSPDVSKKFRELTITPVGSTAEEVLDIIRKDTERWRKVAQVAKIRPE